MWQGIPFGDDIFQHAARSLPLDHFCQCPLQVVYFQAEAYPASPAMLMCNDDERLNGELQALNDQFEEYAVFSDVLRALCGVLKLGEHPPVWSHLTTSIGLESYFSPWAT